MPTKINRSEAIRKLVVNLGDVEKTMQETGISKRTLQRLKYKLKSNDNIVYWRYSAKSTMIQRSYEQIRDLMLTELQHLLQSMNQLAARHGLHYVNAVTRLLNHILKLEATIDQVAQHEIIIKIVDPESALSDEDLNDDEDSIKF